MSIEGNKTKEKGAQSTSVMMNKLVMWIGERRKKQQKK